MQKLKIVDKLQNVLTDNTIYLNQKDKKHDSYEKEESFAYGMMAGSILNHLNSS